MSKRQFSVIDDLLAGEYDERAVLAKHKVTRNVYNRWLADRKFSDELRRRIESAHRQGELIIARYASVAAAKLVQLTDSENQETARKACVDIISLPKSKGASRQTKPQPEPKPPAQLSPEKASRLLAALAKERGCTD